MKIVLGFSINLLFTRSRWLTVDKLSPMLALIIKDSGENLTFVHHGIFDVSSSSDCFNIYSNEKFKMFDNLNERS
jgi:hypothetical protein